MAGGPTTGSDDAFWILFQLNQGAELQDITTRGGLLAGEHFRSIGDLLSRPWWSRAWKAQEALLAQRAALQCGQNEPGLHHLLDTRRLWEQLNIAHSMAYTHDTALKS
jgi:hypothetical protein